MMKDGILVGLQQVYEYGWIIALAVVGLVAVAMLGVRGLLSRARALPKIETEYPQQSTAWKGIPRVPGPSTQFGWRELLALVVGAVICAVVVGLVMRYGSSFPQLRLIFPTPPLR
jgi:hypothetical protein